MAKFKFVGDPKNWEWVKKQDGSREKRSAADPTDRITLHGLTFERGKVVDVDEKLTILNGKKKRVSVVNLLARNNHFVRVDEQTSAHAKTTA